MAGPDLSGKSGCGMRRNPGNHLREVRICPDAKSGFVRKIRMWNAEKSGQSPWVYPNLSGCEMGNPDFFGCTRGDCPDFSKKSGYERRRNPGNHLGYIRICPDAKFGKIRICLLAACC